MIRPASQLEVDTAKRALRVELAPPGQDEAPPGEFLLADVGFGDVEACFARVPLRVLHGPSVERWLCREPVVETGDDDAIRFRATEHLLFGELLLDETGRSLRAQSEFAYRRLFEFLARRPQQHLVRIWNFMPAINDGEGDAERYREFCVGRHQAVEALGRDGQALPAATAIGSHRPGLVIQFLASAHGYVPVENPRQVSAYRYPRRYGPRSPLFSRAAVLGDARGGRQLLVSGTASVVGHESRHRNRVDAQLAESVRNLEALRAASTCTDRIQALRVYLRDSGELDTVLRGAEGIDELAVPLVVLEGDICRSDLLVEIEAVC